jgi:hypothetical protein
LDNEDGDKKWSGKRVSNPRPSAWEADALPTELLPLFGKTKIEISPKNQNESLKKAKRKPDRRKRETNGFILHQKISFLILLMEKLRWKSSSKPML